MDDASEKQELSPSPPRRYGRRQFLRILTGGAVAAATGSLTTGCSLEEEKPLTKEELQKKENDPEFSSWKKEGKAIPNLLEGKLPKAWETLDADGFMYILENAVFPELMNCLDQPQFLNYDVSQMRANTMFVANHEAMVIRAGSLLPPDQAKTRTNGKVALTISSLNPRAKEIRVETVIDTTAMKTFWQEGRRNFDTNAETNKQIMPVALDTLAEEMIHLTEKKSWPSQSESQRLKTMFTDQIKSVPFEYQVVVLDGPVLIFGPQGGSDLFGLPLFENLSEAYRAYTWRAILKCANWKIPEPKTQGQTSDYATSQLFELFHQRMVLTAGEFLKLRQKGFLTLIDAYQNQAKSQGFDLKDQAIATVLTRIANFSMMPNQDNFNKAKAVIDQTLPVKNQ